MLSGTSTLAVGKPSAVPPRWSPRTTGPRTWWSRPSRAAASSTRPSPTSRRMRVEEMGSDPSGGVGGQRHPVHLEAGLRSPSPATGRRSPCARGRNGSPPPPPPGGHRGRRPGSVLTKSSAVSLARSASKGTTTVRSTPAAAKQLELLVEIAEQLGRRLGADHHGRMAVEGDDHGGQPGVAGPGAQLGRAGPGDRDARRRRRRWSRPSRRVGVRTATGRSGSPHGKATAGSSSPRPCPRRHRHADAPDDRRTTVRPSAEAAPHPADSSTTAGRMRSVSVAS